jgi:rRNA-processing protein FCF1
MLRLLSKFRYIVCVVAELTEAEKKAKKKAKKAASKAEEKKGVQLCLTPIRTFIDTYYSTATTKYK